MDERSPTHLGCQRGDFPRHRETRYFRHRRRRARRGEGHVFCTVAGELNRFEAGRQSTIEPEHSDIEMGISVMDDGITDVTVPLTPKLP